MSEETIQNKKEFRKRMLACRDALPEGWRKEYDSQRRTFLMELPEYREAKLLLAYVSFRSEADTRELITAALAEGKEVAVPRVRGKEMVFYRITALSDLTEGYMGILEPKEEMPRAELEKYSPGEVFFCVPGAAFDRSGGRIGYGGGFYDRFIGEFPHFTRTALAYEVQMADCVPREAHDFCVHRIVTENGVYMAMK